MKRTIIVLMLLSWMFLLSSNVPPYESGKYYEKVIVVGFEWDSIGNRECVLDFSIIDGVVETGLSSFDELSRQYGFVNLEQTVDFVKDLDWNDNGIYPRAIYRIFLAENHNIEEAMTALQEDKNIIFAEYDPILKIAYEPNDPSFPSQWHHNYIQSAAAWDYTFGSDEIVIGIVDSGILWNHPDLQANIWVNEAELNSTLGGTPMNISWPSGTISGGNGLDDDGNGKIDDVIGWNFYLNNNNSFQNFADNDHGTHVAGCAGAVGDNYIGVAGAAMTVKLISSMHAPNNTSSSSIYNGNNGIYYCADSGADIINCSWGGPGGGTASNTAVNYAVAQGALVFAAAGNESLNIGISPHYPGNATNAVCVAATGPNSDVIANFSNYGTPVDVSAPGDNIFSTIIANNGYAAYGGTSMASPVAAGVAAIIKSIHPYLGPMDLKQRIEETCDDIDALNPGFEGMLGAGRVNSFKGAMYDLIPDLQITDSSFFEIQGDGDGLPNPGEQVGLMLYLSNSDGWLGATGVSAVISCDLPEVTFIEDEIQFPDIAGGASAWNTSLPFSFQTPDDMSDYVIPLTITITANSQYTWPYESERDFTVELTLVQAGWPYSVNGASTSAGAIVDLNNDGNKEIVFGDQNGMLHILNSDGTVQIPPINTGGIISAAVAIGDISGDGMEEIVVGNEAGWIKVYDHTGTEIMTYDCGGSLKGTPMIADVNGDGNNEIIAASFIGGQLHVIKNDGTSFLNFPTSLSGGMLSTPAIGDLNGDGNLDIVIATLNGSLDVIDTSTGEQLTGWPFSLGAGSWNGPIISNVDSDSDPEVVVGTLNNKLFVLNHDGSLHSETNVGAQIKTSVVTADFNNNGTQDIAFVTGNGNVYIVDSQGNAYPNFPLSLGTMVESTPIVADIDNNGTPDLIFGDNIGLLHSIDITGNETINFPINLKGTIKTSPAIADSDGDGDLEILVPNNTGYVLVDYKHNSGSVQWANFNRNPRRTGNALDATTDSQPSDIPALDFALNQNYPNPFNPSTNISFNLAKNSHVELAIYNIKGQLVKTLVNGQKNAGTHIVNWNGKDESGKDTSSGIYFYKISTDKNFTSIRKMILLR